MHLTKRNYKSILTYILKQIHIDSLGAKILWQNLIKHGLFNILYNIAHTCNCKYAAKWNRHLLVFILFQLYTHLSRCRWHSFFVGYIPYTCVSKFERHKYSFPIYIWDQNTIFNKTLKQSYKIIYLFNLYSTKRHIKKLFTHM